MIRLNPKEAPALAERQKPVGTAGGPCVSCTTHMSSPHLYHVSETSCDHHDSSWISTLAPPQPLQRVPTELWAGIAKNLLARYGKGLGEVILAGDLVPFSGTCRAFHELAMPIMYRNLRWHTRSSDAADARRTRALSNTLGRHQHLYTLVHCIRVFGDGNPLDDTPDDNVIPLERFTSLRLLHLQGIRLTPQIHCVILSLPILQQLSLVLCSIGTDTELPLPDSVQPSRSLKELELILPMIPSASHTFLEFFKHLRSFMLIAFGTNIAPIFRSIITHNLAGALTSITVAFETEDSAASFIDVLNTAPRLETIRISPSDVRHITVPGGSVPLLHAFKGPPHLVRPFIQGRRLQTVGFFGNRDDTVAHMDVLQYSLTSISTLFLENLESWSENLTDLIVRYAPGLCTLDVAFKGPVVS
jgi:hypothetical protein